MTDQAPIDVQQAENEPQIPAEQLRVAAHAAVSGWHVMHRPKGKAGFARRVEAARDALDILTSELQGVEINRDAGPDPLLEIRENPRLLRAVVLEAFSIRRKVEQLPRVVLSGQEEETRASVLSSAYLDAADSTWSADAFRSFIDEAQKTDALELRELWVVPVIAQVSAAGVDSDPGERASACACIDCGRFRGSVAHSHQERARYRICGVGFAD